MRAGREGDGDRRTRLLLYAFAASALVAVAVVLGVIFLTGDDNPTGPGGRVAEGCTLKSYPTLEGTHLATLEGPRPKWNSFPPTSGPHYAQPAPVNFYEEPVNPRIVVHNLEHGIVAIQYGNQVPAATVDRLREFWRDDPNAVVVAPLPQLGDKITATAWVAPPYQEGTRESRGRGWLLSCDNFNEEQFAKFRDERRGKGPERVPVEALTPGT